MTKNEFIEKYTIFEEQALTLLKKAKKEGLFSIEDDIDDEKVKERDIFHYGLYLVVNGVESKNILEILPNIINQEKDEYTAKLKTIQLEAVLAIQCGDVPRMLYAKMNSHTDLPITFDKMFDNWRLVKQENIDYGVKEAMLLLKKEGVVARFENEAFPNGIPLLSGGVWISPDGDIIGISETHVKAVVSDPTRFEMSANEIKEIYHKHNEGVGCEGNARDEIISMLVSKGWIRIRFYPSDNCFHVQFNDLNIVNKKYLHQWAFKVIDKKPEMTRVAVIIYETGKTETTCELQELIDDKISIDTSKIYPLQFEDSTACWLCPDGKVIGTHGSHTSTVIENPEDFRLTKKEADALFAIGEEVSVLKKLVGNGWNRIRFFGKCYFISVNRLSFERKDLLCSWAMGTLRLHSNREDCVAIIEELSALKLYKILLKNMVKGDFSNNSLLEIDLNVMCEYENWSIVKST